MSYQKSWDWIQCHWDQPFPSVAYVAAVSCVIGTKNVLVTTKHDVYVEVLPLQDSLIQEADVWLPRVCIVPRATAAQLLYHHLSQRGTTFM